MISSRMLRKGELTETDYRDVRGLPPLPPPAADTLAPEPDGEPPAADTAATGGCRIQAEAPPAQEPSACLTRRETALPSARPLT